jgi:hypothetical protein
MLHMQTNHKRPLGTMWLGSTSEDYTVNEFTAVQDNTSLRRQIWYQGKLHTASKRNTLLSASTRTAGMSSDYLA